IRRDGKGEAKIEDCDSRLSHRATNAVHKSYCSLAGTYVSSAVDYSFASDSSSVIRQLDRSDGAIRPVARETRPHPGSATELCPPAFLCSGQGEFGLHGSSGYSRITAASGGVHWPQ